MKPYHGELKEDTKENADFQRVLFTGFDSQLVIMAIQAQEETGEEVHDGDQILYAVDGEAEAIVDGREMSFEKGDVLAIPAGSRHNIRNTGDCSFKLFTVYAPPQLAAGLVQRTAPEAWGRIAVTVP